MCLYGYQLYITCAHRLIKLAALCRPVLFELATLSSATETSPCSEEIYTSFVQGNVGERSYWQLFNGRCPICSGVKPVSLSRIADFPNHTMRHPDIKSSLILIMTRDWLASYPWMSTNLYFWGPKMLTIPNTAGIAAYQLPRTKWYSDTSITNTPISGSYHICSPGPSCWVWMIKLVLVLVRSTRLCSNSGPRLQFLIPRIRVSGKWDVERRDGEASRIIICFITGDLQDM